MAEFLSRLDGVIPQRDGWKALCPAHDDHRQSLSVKAGHKQPIVVTCHAGCKRESILTALALTFSDISSENGPRLRTPPAPVGALVAAYDYRDRDGHVVYQSVRYDPKDFRQRRPDGEGGWIWNMDGVEKIPYRLDEIALFCSLGNTIVVITEGEKDADALWDLGIPATTNVGGAGKWNGSDAQVLRQVGVTEVRLIPDHDTPGRNHMRSVGSSSVEAGLAVRWLDLPGLKDKQDLSDWLAIPTNTAAVLRELLATAPSWPPVTPRTTLDDVHKVFRKWLGPEFDLFVVDAVLAAAASEKLAGDPVWM